MGKSAAVEVRNGMEQGFVGKIKSWPQRTKGFFKDVRTEMKKVTTPSGKEVRATTTVVLITIFIFGAYFWVVDNVIGRGIEQVFRYFTR